MITLSFAGWLRATTYTFYDTGSTSANTVQLSGILAALNGNAGPSQINFPAGHFIFDSTGDQMNALSNVHNLTIQGVANSTTLDWHFSCYPSSFFNISQDSSDINISNIKFTTHGYLATTPPTHDVIGRQLGVRSVDGSHIKIAGKRCTVENCFFEWSPDHAILIDAASSQDSNQYDNIKIQYNSFENSIGDSVHVVAGSGVTIYRNWIHHSGDDAIAVYNDLYGSGPGKNSKIPTHITIEGNVIVDGHWRAILIGTCFDVTVIQNNIHGTARFGIEVCPVDDTMLSTGWSKRDSYDAYPNIVIIRENHLEYTGYTNDHQAYDVNPIYIMDSHGIYVHNAFNIQIMDNSLTYTRGYGVRMEHCWQVGIALGNNITNYGSQIGATGNNPGFVSEIFNPPYTSVPSDWKLVNAWGLPDTP